MAICSSCQSESSRVRTKWAEDGSTSDECPTCAPSSFERFTDPSDKKIWMGYEVHPGEYEKRYDKEGLIYERKPEYRAEQEERISQATEEEREAQERAIAKKRAERRTSPMDRVEMSAAMRRAEEVASWIVASNAQGRDVN